MGAEIALGSSMRIRVDVKGVIRACLQTRFTANAPLGVEVDDAILVAAVQRSDRTRRYAGGVIAVVAPQHGEVAAIVGKLARLYVLDPRAVDAKGHVVFGLASDRTGVAANALAVVDEKAKSHAGSSYTLGRHFVAQLYNSGCRTTTRHT